jgi:uncharacterized protein YPO0396
MMETMTRSSWTDDRLDDLNVKVDHGFEQVGKRFDGVEAEIRLLRQETKEEFAAVRQEMKEEFAAVRQEMKEEFAAVRSEMKEGFTLMEKRFDRMDDRLYDLHKTTNRLGVGIIVTLIGALLAQQL